MPSIAQHQRKYLSNLAFFNNIKNNGYYDWQVTVIFYTTLHKVRSTLLALDVDLADYTSRIGRISHGSVERAIEIALGDTVATDYKALLQLSYRARYEAGIRIRADAVKIAQELFQGIEKACDEAVERYLSEKEEQSEAETETGTSTFETATESSG